MARNIHIVNILVKHHYARCELAPDGTSCNTCAMNITTIRRQRKLTQIDLAEISGTSQATVSRAEAGDDSVTLQQFKAIAAALNVPLWQLFAENMTSEESVLLDVYRRLEPARQMGWLDMARALAEDRQSPSQ